MVPNRTVMNQPAKQIRIGVCRLWPGEKLPPGDVRWGRHAHSFVRETHTLESLFHAVTKDGAAISAVVKNNHRTGANFVEAFHLGLDFDAGNQTSSLDALQENAFITDHAAFIYETPSSTPEAPKSRAIFVLDSPFNDPQKYRAAALALIWKFGAAADPACHDPARFFYGRLEAPAVLLGNYLYGDTLIEEILEPHQASEAQSSGRRKSTAIASERIFSGGRNQSLMSLAGVMRRRNLSEPAIRAAIHEENLQRCDPPLEAKEVDQIVDSVLRYSPSPVYQDDPYDELPPLEDHQTSPLISISSNGNGASSTPSGLSTHLTAFLHELPFTDLGNSERLVALFGHQIRYSYQGKNWYVWDGTRWNHNNTGDIYLKASLMVRRMYAEAGSLEAKAAQMDNEKEREKVSKLAETLSAFARKSEAVARIEAMVKLAQSRPGIPVVLSELDSDPWLLNVKNGTLDLHTSKLKPHDPMDLITKLAPVDYEPGAGYQLWNEFLDRILPDQECQSFVQRAAGYSLTGENTEEKLFFAYGPTATGKSTFLRAIRTAIGDYAAVADFSTFLEKQKGNSGPSNDIARLAGKRFVVSIEVEQGQKLAESLVQTITGGDPIAARFMYSEFFEFIPSFTLWMAANNRPRVRDDNDANWRRIVQIPFTNQIPEAERDDSIKAALSDPQIAGPAILNWLVEGCNNWQTIGLKIPEIVREATKDYRNEMNPLMGFMEECCVVINGAQVSNAELWETYLKWVRQGNVRFPLGRKNFSQRLESIDGVTSERDANKRFWVGIGIVGEDQ